MHRLLFAITMGFLMLCGAEEASAYVITRCSNGKPAKWASNAYAVAASTNMSGDWKPYVASVVSRWNNNPSNVGVTATYGDTNVREFNRQSEIWWETKTIDDPPAYTQPWLDMNTCQFIEADVVFNTAQRVPWTASGYTPALLPYGGNNRTFQSTAIHEFGHAIGLAHTPNTYSVMGQDYTHLYTNGSVARAYVGADASAGAVAIYGLWSNGPDDLSVVHWRWRGTQTGEYADHCRTRIYNSAGAALASTTGFVCYGREPYFRVSRGQTVQLEMTYENLGKSAKAFYTGYYVSADATINTADQFITYSSINLGRDTLWTALTPLVIPTNLVSGNFYWLGAVVDYNGAVAERDNNNNATYVGIYVQ